MIPARLPALAAGFHDVPAGHLAAVVTALEMRDDPRLAAPAPRPDVALEPLDISSLAPYRALFRHVGTPWLWTSRLAWTDEALAATIQHPDVHVYQAVNAPEGAAIGLLELDFRQPGQCEIAFFGLAVESTGRGLGGWLMGHGLALAWARAGVERVWLHTCTLDSPWALGFYMRQGFKPFARFVEILPDPRLRGDFAREAAPAIPVL